MSQSPSTARRLAWWGRAVGSWFVLLAVLLVVAITVAVPVLAGGTAYTVLSSSMRPTLPPGALVVTRPVQANDLAIGDVVTYQIRSGEPAVVTHRVVALRLAADGQVLAQTKGDFNGAPDPELVQPEQLRGRLWYSLPYLGYLNAAVAGHGRVMVVAGVVVGLVAYAGWMFASSARDRRRLPVQVQAQADHAG
ncbi:MAG TPA: signal peptidase I [Friedmanniella sp.]